MKKILMVAIFGMLGCAHLEPIPTAVGQNIWLVQKVYGENDKVVYCERREKMPACIVLVVLEPGNSFVKEKDIKEHNLYKMNEVKEPHIDLGL